MEKSGFDCNQSILCDLLFKVGAIKFGNFRLKLHDKHPEAPESPIYCDLRVVQRFPEVSAKAVAVYLRLLVDLKFDLLAGIPIAATPFTASIRDKLNVGMVTPRMEAKTHGTGTKIDGLLDDDKGKTVVLIDDLVTKADSKIEAAEIIRECGLVVKDVVVLIDRNQGGKEQLAQAGLALHSALGLDKMLLYYLETDQIDEDTYQDTVYKLHLLSQYK